MTERITIRLPDDMVAALKQRAGTTDLATHIRQTLARSLKIPAPVMPQGFAATGGASAAQALAVASRLAKSESVAKN